MASAPLTPATAGHPDAHVFNRYKIQEQLGVGSFGTVWKAKDRETKHRVAVKLIRDAFSSAATAHGTFREVLLLRKLDSQHVIRLLDVQRSRGRKDLFLVFEYLEMNLAHALCMGYLQLPHKRAALHQVLRGLQYLHRRCVIHRDLKPANILIDRSCNVRICDFGMSRPVSAAAAPRTPGAQRQASRGPASAPAAGRPYDALLCLHTLCGEPPAMAGEEWEPRDGRGDGVAAMCRAAGALLCLGAPRHADPPTPEARGRGMTMMAATQWYCAPEVLLLSKWYSLPVDLWGIGCILGELLGGRPLFPGSSSSDQLARIVAATGMPTEDDLCELRCGPGGAQLLSAVRTTAARPLRDRFRDAPEPAVELLLRLLVLNPLHRPTCDEVLCSSYFAELEAEVGPAAPAGPPIELPFDGPDDGKLAAAVYRDQLYLLAGVPELPPEPPPLRIGSDGLSESSSAYSSGQSSPKSPPASPSSPTRQTSMRPPSGLGSPSRQSSRQASAFAMSPGSSRQPSNAPSAATSKGRKKCPVQ